MGVHAVFLNGKEFGQGRMTLSEIVSKVDTNADARAAKAISGRDPFEVLIIGSGPAGASAAVYTARKGIRTGVIGERFGGQVMDTVDIENYISVLKTEGAILAGALKNHVDSYNVDVIDGQSVTKLIPAEEIGGYHQIETASGGVMKARSIIIATGARWRNMGVPGEQEYRTKGVTFCPHCDGPLFKGKRVAVIGGGNSGIEAAIDLAGIVEHVTVLEFASELKADSVLQAKARSLSNIDIILNAQTLEVKGDGSKMTSLEYKDRTDESVHSLEVAGAFVQIGLLPNTNWLGDTVARNRMGEIEVDARNETSVKGVFAAGDCTTVPYKQIIISAGEGAKAALSAFDYLIRTSTRTAE
jgi:alkyl hydroperoxide reductase subunit F